MKYSYWLHNIPEMTNAKIRRLYKAASSAEEIYHMSPNLLKSITGITEDDVESIHKSQKKWEVDKEWFNLMERGIGFVSFEQSDFPEKVRHISNPPYALYYVGKLPEENRKTVAIVGARVYYIIFRWEEYKDNILSVFNLRNGGLGIYGGILVALVVCILFAKHKKIKLGLFLDTACISLVSGQVIGRWGNFFNREAFGGYSDGLLAMQLPVSAVRRNEITAELWEHAVELEGITYIQVHPTFLYESLWNLALMISLLIYWKHRKFNGEVFLLYLLGYGIGRFWIESLRTDQLILPILEVPVSMVVAALMVVGSAIWIILGRKKAQKAEEK